MEAAVAALAMSIDAAMTASFVIDLAIPTEQGCISRFPPTVDFLDLLCISRIRRT
jgi:hypothetical protein